VTAEQTGLAETLGKISPAVCWTYSAVALTDTGPGAYQQLSQARKNLRKGIDDLNTLARQQRRESDEWPEITVDDVPQLQVIWPTFADAAKSALNSVLILVIVNVVFFMSALLAFLRCDVT